MDWFQVIALCIAVLLREFATTIRNLWGARQKNRRRATLPGNPKRGCEGGQQTRQFKLTHYQEYILFDIIRTGA